MRGLLFIILGFGMLSNTLHSQYCGMDDNGNDLRGNINVRNDYLYGTSWNKRILTYAFDNYTTTLSQSIIENTIKTAAERWSNHINIDFMKVCNTNNADIIFGWVNGDDPDEFPGAFGTRLCAGVIAHGFYPPPYNENWNGFLHFTQNSDVVWKVSDAQGADCSECELNLLANTVHELGHVLGLIHRPDPNNAMYRYSCENENLNTDNINDVVSLYGSRTTAITGPDIFCGSSTITLEVDGYSSISSDIYYTWNVSSGVNIISGQGTGQIQISTSGTNLGNVTISLLVSSGCDSKSFNKTIWHGLPEFQSAMVDNSPAQYPSINYNPPALLQTETEGLTQSYSWTKTAGQGNIYPYPSTTYFNQCEAYPNNYLSVKCTATNTCGSKDVYTYNVANGAQGMVYYENPTDGIFTLYLSEYIKKNDKIKNILILDSYQNVLEELSQKNITESEINFDLTRYPTGLYYIHIQLKKSTIVEKVFKL